MRRFDELIEAEILAIDEPNDIYSPFAHLHTNLNRLQSLKRQFEYCVLS
jgi:hypothetical protein